MYTYTLLTTTYTGVVKRGFWILMFLGMTAGLTYNLYGLTSNYLSYPISVTIQVVPEQEITFPSVTLCNLSPVKQSSYQKLLNRKAIRKRRRKRQGGGGGTGSGFPTPFSFNFPNVTGMT